jgi:hypothetical protein
VPPIDSQTGGRYVFMKLLKVTWLDGNFPFTIAVSAIRDSTLLPALATYRPMLSP